MSSVSARTLRPLALVAPLIAGSALGLCAPARAARKPATPTAAPSFSLPAMDGTASLDSLRGKVVLVDFWASWCGPCRKSFPWMKAMVERYRSLGFTVVAVNLDKRREDADAFLGEYPPTFPVAFDPAGKTAESYKVKAMPTSFLVDRGGAIVYSHAGFDPKATAGAESLIVQTCAR